jgi:hypothetical protein
MSALRRWAAGWRADVWRHWAHVPAPNWACSRRKHPLSVYW